MFSIFKRFTTTLALLSLLVLATSVPASAAFDPTNEACKTAPESAACQSRGNTNVNPVTDTIKRVTNIVGVVAGVVAVFMIIFFGFQFVGSAGDTAKAKSARMGIIFAAVGLAVIALSVPLINIIINAIG